MTAGIPGPRAREEALLDARVVLALAPSTTLGAARASQEPATPPATTVETPPPSTEDLPRLVQEQSRHFGERKKLIDEQNRRIDELEIQPEEARRRTARFSLNIAWSPITRLDPIAEYLWCTRHNKDDGSGQAHQVQLGGLFRF